jgi:glycosyltransferase involved in cell wall biosynthesis
MKILFFINKLYGGGAERVASILLNHLCKQHDVTAAVFDDRKSYAIDERVKIINISVGKRLRPYQLNRIVKCRKSIKTTKPDLIISFMVDLNRFVIIANLHTNIKLIVSEHITLQTKQSFIRKITRHILYKLAAKVTLLTRSDYNYAKWLNNKVIIYNPLDMEISSNNLIRDKKIIAIGPQNRWNGKGFDLLVLAWEKIASSHPEWKLQFVGEVNDNKISEMVKEYNLKNQVDFLGWSDNIDKVLQTKSIYVLSSRHEGFPCSLLEAMSQGCACVAFDCKTGPNEIITDGISGQLARDGDVDDLAAKLQQLIEDENLRQRLSAGAVEEVKRFDKKLIMKQWDELIEDVTQSAQR